MSLKEQCDDWIEQELESPEIMEVALEIEKLFDSMKKDKIPLKDIFDALRSEDYDFYKILDIALAAMFLEDSGRFKQFTYLTIDGVVAYKATTPDTWPKTLFSQYEAIDLSDKRVGYYIVLEKV
jgi:hypothetical protein